MNWRRLMGPLLRPGAADYQLVQAGLVVAFGLMQHSPALRCDRVDRLGWVKQSPHYVSFINQSVEAAARLVVADRLIAPFELSKQSKLIIGQPHHQSLRCYDQR